MLYICSRTSSFFFFFIYIKIPSSGQWTEFLSQKFYCLFVFSLRFVDSPHHLLAPITRYQNRDSFPPFPISREKFPIWKCRQSFRPQSDNNTDRLHLSLFAYFNNMRILRSSFNLIAILFYPVFLLLGIRLHNIWNLFYSEMVSRPLVPFYQVL